MSDITAQHTVTIPIMGIDVLALKKLALVSHALARRLGGQAAEEQTCLATVLDHTVRNIELAIAAKPTAKA